MSIDMEKIILSSDVEYEDITPVIIPYFSVSSKSVFDAESFTSLVGIQPTSTWVQKKPWLINKKGITQASWRYRFRYMSAEWIEKATDKILSLFYPLRGIIKPFIQQNRLNATVYLRIFTTGSENYPLMLLERKTMRHIRELGASFQMDIYSIDKIESYEKLTPITYKTKKDGSTYWVLREVK